jgi:hypothetical protein
MNQLAGQISGNDRFVFDDQYRSLLHRLTASPSGSETGTLKVN